MMRGAAVPGARHPVRSYFQPQQHYEEEPVNKRPPPEVTGQELRAGRSVSLKPHPKPLGSAAPHPWELLRASPRLQQKADPDVVSWEGRSDACCLSFLWTAPPTALDDISLPAWMCTSCGSLLGQGHLGLGCCWAPLEDVHSRISRPFHRAALGRSWRDKGRFIVGPAGGLASDHSVCLGAQILRVVLGEAGFPRDRRGSGEVKCCREASSGLPSLVLTTAPPSAMPLQPPQL